MDLLDLIVFGVACFTLGVTLEWNRQRRRRLKMRDKIAEVLYTWRSEVPNMSMANLQTSAAVYLSGTKAYENIVNILNEK